MAGQVSWQMSAASRAGMLFMPTSVISWLPWALQNCARCFYVSAPPTQYFGLQQHHHSEHASPSLNCSTPMTTGCLPGL